MAQHSRVSRISTAWSVVRQAHRDSPLEATDARIKLVERYEGAVYRYLLGATRDKEAADELFQEFAVKLMRGAFAAVTPDRGRFRDYLRRALINLVTDHQRKQQQAKRQVRLDFDVPADLSSKQPESRFAMSWKEELLFRTWSELEQFSVECNKPYFAALKFRIANQQMKSSELANSLSQQLSASYSATGVRKLIQRARDKFADLLLDEVARSLESASLSRIEEEVIDLGLHQYCRSALAQRRRSAAG